MGANYAVDYDNPVIKLSASSDALSKGIGLFEKGPLSIFDNDGTIQERLELGIFHVTTMEDYSTSVFATGIPYKRLGFKNWGSLSQEQQE